MSDILKRIKQSHTPASEQLQQAQALLRSNATWDKKLVQLEALEAAAPDFEKPMFADLFSSLQLSRGHDGR